MGVGRWKEVGSEGGIERRTQTEPWSETEKERDRQRQNVQTIVTEAEKEKTT